MDRNRIVVITDPVTAEGFLLTGVDVLSFVDPYQARDEIRRLLKSDATEILVANDEYIEGMDDSVKRRMKSPEPPILISLPVKRTRGLGSSAALAVAALELQRLAERTSGGGDLELDHRISYHELEVTTCRSCGHQMEPGMRICDRCGSIQRSVRLRGEQEAVAMSGSCRVCGAKIAERKTVCVKCSMSPKKHGAESVPADRNTVSTPRRAPFHAFLTGLLNLLSRISGGSKRH